MKPHAREPPEEILAQKTLRKRGNALTRGKGDLLSGCELFGDLEARVSPSYDDHLAVRKLRWVAVVSAMDLEDRVVEIFGNGRHEGDLEGPVATTTWSAVIPSSAVLTRYFPSRSLKEVTFALSFTGRSNADT
jgi:hypothetical protein